MLNCRRFLFVAALLFVVPVAMALEPGEPDPLFQGDSVIEIRITAPMKSLLRERSDEDYLPGTLTYTEADGSVVELDIGIRTRGNFRRQPRVCPFPPLRVNFKKSQVENTLFHDQDKLKLVAHCRDRSDRYQQHVFKEYLAYRILNTLTRRQLPRHDWRASPILTAEKRTRTGFSTGSSSNTRTACRNGSACRRSRPVASAHPTSRDRTRTSPRCFST